MPIFSKQVERLTVAYIPDFGISAIALLSQIARDHAGQRLLNDVVRFAMQWALNPHIRTFTCSASSLFAASRSLFAASRPTVCGCADRQVETA